ncbi:hypothetical protein HY041_00210, partial [Candidatus Roizmanbacteria bacterium]|nr:hypothetical protein [Candidatus Roizmanbacteria bacterium]
MADVEAKPGNTESTVQKAQEQIQKEINEAKRTGKEKELAQKLIQELKDTKFKAEQVVDDVKKPGGINTHLEEGKKSTETLVRVLKKTWSPAADIVVNALADQATEFGRTGKDIRDQYGVSEPPSTPQEPPATDEETLRKLQRQQQMSERILAGDVSFDNVPADDLHDTLIKASADYAQEYASYFSRRFTDPNEKNLIAAIYNPHAFITYVDGKKTEITNKLEKEGKSTTGEKVDKEIREELSSNLRKDMTDLLEKIFVQLRRERAEKPFDEIAREDFYHGISVSLVTLNNRLDTLAAALDGLEEKGTKTIKLYKEAELEPTSEEVELGKDKNGEVKTGVRFRIKPIPTSREVSLSEFVKDSLRLVVSEASHVRQYLHDGRTIYYHPADPEKGFYAGLGRYAEGLHGSDVDGLFNLPDGQLIQSAYQLYSKYLFEQFSKQNWKHEPEQFINQLGSRYSLTEEEVINALQKENPGLSRERAESAVHMGVGMSRAIFLNEPEMAAFADPVLSDKGAGTGTSYYTNDTASLSPLNPLHWFMRWQGEQQIYPFLFAPVDALGGGGLGGGWNHKKVMELGTKYFESYWKGRKEMGGRRLFIDEIINMSRAGGPIQRKGWRQFFANEGNFIFEPNSTNLDALKTWKALENVGYEVVYDLVSSYGGRFPDPLMRASNDKDAAGKTWAQKRTEFFQYLYEKYFDSNQGSLGEYLGRIREGEKGARETALKRIRKGEASPNTVEEEIE